MTSQGIPASPQELASHRAFLCHVTTIVQGRETSKVVRPIMVHTNSFIQLVDMHRSTPCITLLGLESDNKIQSPVTSSRHYFTIKSAISTNQEVR